MGQYPYVVVRYMAAVYGQFPVRFAEPQEVDPDPKERREAFVIAWPMPFVDGHLTAQARQALIDAVQQASRQSRHQMCAVFGELDCVYCEPDGTAKPSDEPPAGGIRCLQFPISLQPR